MLVPFGKSVSSLADSYNQSKYKYKNPYACNRKYNQIDYNRYGYRAQAQQKQTLRQQCPKFHIRHSGKRERKKPFHTVLRIRLCDSLFA